MRARVAHFHGRSYVIFYSTRWWKPERRLNMAWVKYDSADLNERNFPVIFDDFEDAVSRAKSLTPENVAAWEKDQDKIFAAKQEKVILEEKWRKNRTFST